MNWRPRKKSPWWRPSRKNKIKFKNYTRNPCWQSKIKRKKIGKFKIWGKRHPKQTNWMNNSKSNCLNQSSSITNCWFSIKFWSRSINKPKAKFNKQKKAFCNCKVTTKPSDNKNSTKSTKFKSKLHN